MPLELTPEQAARIAQKVAEGLYPSAEVALNAALELLDEYDRKLAALRRDIQEGLAQAEAGRLTPADQVFDHLQRRLGQPARR